MKKVKKKRNRTNFRIISTTISIVINKNFPETFDNKRYNHAFLEKRCKIDFFTTKFIIVILEHQIDEQK